MLKGTITAPDENGVSEIELKDSSETFLGMCSKIAVSAVVAATGVVATYCANRAIDYFKNKKKSKKN